MTRLSHDHGGRHGLRPGTSVLAALLLAGCGPDAEGKFEQFLEEAAPRLDMGPMKEDIPPEKMDVGVQDDSPKEVVDLTGTSLLALATKIDPTKPLQLLSTVTQRTEGENIFIDVELQPLSLDKGKVTTPRQLVGEKLIFKDIPVIDGKYTIDAGTVMVTGAANPVTGTDIVATLVLDATVIDGDFVCGTLSGMLTMPLEFDLEGSTFASARVEGLGSLPTDVTVNCKRETRTDPP